MNPGNPRRLPVSLRIAILTTALSFTLAWQFPPDQETDIERGIRLRFKYTRKKTAATPPTARKNPPPQQSRETDTPPENKKATPPLPAVGSDTIADIAGRAPIGIGYTLYKCIEKVGRRCKNDSKVVRVDTDGEVQTGDIVRFTIEPNIDGFLYIFNAVNNGEPKMAFPHHQLGGGDNKIEAHVLYQTPPPMASDPDPWFTISDRPEYATLSKIIEDIYIVVTRKPLPKIPTGSELVNFCRSFPSGGDCRWPMTSDQFNLVRAGAGKSLVAKSRDEIGKAISAVESEAISKKRDIVYSAPEPSLVVMNESAEQDTLLMKTQLVHIRR